MMPMKREKLSDLSNFVRRPLKNDQTETELPEGWTVEKMPKRPATPEEIQRVVEQVVSESQDEADTPKS